MTSASWAMTMVIAVNALLFHAMPRFSRPDILFAVTVTDAFVSGAGRALVSRYRTILWTGAVVALAASLLIPAPLLGSGRGELLMMAAVAGNMNVSLSAVGERESAPARHSSVRGARGLSGPPRHDVSWLADR